MEYEPTRKRRLRFESKGEYQALRGVLLRNGRATEYESGAFLFASQATDGVLDIAEVIVLKHADFVVQSARFLELKDGVLQQMIIRAHRTKTALIEAHSHPFAVGPRVCFSYSDCVGLAHLGPQMTWRLPGRPYVALVFGQDAFDSLYWEGKKKNPLGTVGLVVAGDLLKPSGDSECTWREAALSG